MSEMRLRQPGFTYSACGPFTKNKKKEFKEAGDARCIYQNQLDKGCFQHDMAYGDFKDLNRRAATDKVLRDKAFNISKDPKYDGYQRGLASMVYKKTSGSSMKNISNKELAGVLHKPIIRRFNKKKVHPPFIDNTQDGDLADMKLISKFNEGFRFLLCVTDTYSKYAQVIPSKHKKGITITNAFPKNLDQSNRKPNKIWVNKGSEFYNRSMKSWLEKNDLEIYSLYNEGKYFVAERFIRTLKSKTDRYMTSI